MSDTGDTDAGTAGAGDAGQGGAADPGAGKAGQGGAGTGGAATDGAGANGAAARGAADAVEGDAVDGDAGARGTGAADPRQAGPRPAEAPDATSRDAAGTAPGPGPRAAAARPAAPRRGRVTAACAALLALLLAGHGLVPNAGPRLGSLLETFLPWLGLAVPVLLLVALLRRSALAAAATALPAAAWLVLFGPLLLPASGGKPDLVAVQHNVSDVNPDPAATARALADAGPQLIALEEVTPPALPAYRRTLAPDYPHHAVVGTVGLWSVHPLTEVRPVDIRPSGIGPGWNRGLRATLRAPGGDIAVYVAHLPSLRLGPGGMSSGPRDESARLLGAALAEERAGTVILLGDLNGTLDDRGLDPLTSGLGVDGPGMAFSWPASFPIARIDQILARGATVTSVRTLPRTGSDHLPVVADIRR